MPQLVFQNPSSSARGERRYVIQKKMTTVGTDPCHDVQVGAESSGVIFTLTSEPGGFSCLPAAARIRLNGQPISRPTRIRSCDRVEWSGGVAVFLETGLANPEVSDPTEAIRSLTLLQNLASSLQSEDSVSSALGQALDALVEMAGAETGYLLVERNESSGWELRASKRSDQASPSRRELFSNTILQEALQKREPVYVENIIGHPWAEAASVIEARIFSAACFPLAVGGKVFGAVFLFTRSPGRSIKKERLVELNLLATQAALMLASQTELRCTRLENAKLRTLLGARTEGFVVSSSAERPSPMLEVQRKIGKLAPTPLSVLILGETGTGKEVVARELHRQSARGDGPFVAVNCAAIPAPLLEATLFGYEKGAFTGAIRSQVGKFVQAQGGTLLLDEIGDLPLELQAKLLRVLQEKQVEPLGSTAAVAVDVRILAATHADLEKAVTTGRFRQDLYYRLNGASLRLPPLRERPQDIAPLAEAFIRKLGSLKPLTPESLSKLESHDWPGNVRELEQLIQRAALLAEGEQIEPGDLELGQRLVEESPDEGGFFARYLEEGKKLEDAQFAFTRSYVRQALTQQGGNRAETAEKLGISERTLYRILAEARDGSDLGSTL